MRKIIGLFLILSPFIALFVGLSLLGHLREAVIGFGIAGIFALLLKLGIYLVFGD